MVTQTPRLGLDTYDDGDTNWDHGDTVEAVDALAITRGPIADRPASGQYDDALFLATDQRLVYRWDVDAADWVVMGHGTANNPIPEAYYQSLTATTIDSKNIPNDVTDSSGFDTWYQNTTGGDMLVTVIVLATSSGVLVDIDLDINDTQNPNTADTVSDAAVDSFGKRSVSGVVPNNAYYKVNSSGDTADYVLDTWVEQT